MKEPIVEPLILFTETFKQEDWFEFCRVKGKNISDYSPEELKEFNKLEEARKTIDWDKYRQEKAYFKLMEDSRKYNKLIDYLKVIGFILFFALIILMGVV